MNRKSLPVIVKVAKKTREIFDIANAEYKTFKPHLKGACAMASACIFDELIALGLSPKIVSSATHTWVVCDGWLIDVTATQFGQPKIVIRNYSKLQHDIQNGLYVMPWWKQLITFDSVEKAGLINLRLDVAEFKRVYEAVKFTKYMR